MPTSKFCPNCGQPAIAEGRKITCEPCDAVYIITKDGATVKSLGRIEDHEQRIQTLEGTDQTPAAPADTDIDDGSDAATDATIDAAAEEEGDDSQEEEDLW